ncbi:MAG: hypothetical protein BRD50_08775, partial [Bacteroidetes bacterium SW_11_45_7]
GPGQAFEYDQGAYSQLLKQLQTAKKKVIERVGSDHSKLVKKVLMMLILIKYLEERQDKNGNTALKREFYREINSRASSLADILNKPTDFITLLGELSSEKHFNGQIFELSEKEEAKLKEFDFGVFQAFVDGQTELFGSPEGIGQMKIWRLYSFDYLPIELISHIYEDFLIDETDQSKPGVVYTPPTLVQLLIDRCMPLSEPKKQCKVLDPACGSGIFLVAAFKRIIQWWRIQNYWKHPSKENIDTLKALLKENVYGCDIEEEAVRLTYFSLSLALLDALSPREIWENVHFDNLIGKNLFGEDFFQKILENNLPNDFDLVIGNPPFQSKLTDPAEKVNSEIKAQNTDRPKIPDKQVVLLFLEQSFKLLKEKGKTCLLLSAGPLLYNTKVHSFKRYLFGLRKFQEIYDFTPLRTKLFKSSKKSAKKPATLAALVENSIPDEGHPIYHLIFRSTRATGEKIEFEIDHYDIHKVPFKIALDSPKVWQANFMGGGRLHQLVERINSLPTLKDYLDEMVKIRNWKVSEGWIESSNSEQMRKLILLQEKLTRSSEEEKDFQRLKNKFSASWITNKPFVETDDFKIGGVKKIKHCPIQFFHRNRKRNKEIFEPPHLLIKETVEDKKIPVEFRSDYLTFRNEIFGISSPASDSNLLKEIESRLKDNKSYAALLWLLSGRIISTREGVVLKENILSLPYPENPLHFDFIEQTLLDDILEYYADFRIEGEKSKALNQTNPDELKAFGKYYCQILNSIYEDFKPLDPIIGRDFIAYPFVLGDKPEIEIPDDLEDVEATLAKLLHHQASHNLWINRILKVYHKNVIFLYKPNQKRYWLRSIAIRDADETFVDLFNQGK